MTYEARLIEKTCKYTGKLTWAVEYANAKGEQKMTSWTTVRAEACAWGRIIQAHGYCMSAKEWPVI